MANITAEVDFINFIDPQYLNSISLFSNMDSTLPSDSLINLDEITQDVQKIQQTPPSSPFSPCSSPVSSFSSQSDQEFTSTLNQELLIYTTTRTTRKSNTITSNTKQYLFDQIQSI